MVRRLQEESVERIVSQQQYHKLLALIRGIYPPFRRQLVALRLSEAEIMVTILESMQQVFELPHSEARDYYENLFENLTCDYAQAYPECEDETLFPVAASFTAHLVAALFYYYEGEHSETLLHSYAQLICNGAAKGGAKVRELRDQLFARLDAHAEELTDIISDFISNADDATDMDSLDMPVPKKRGRRPETLDDAIRGDGAEERHKNREEYVKEMRQLAGNYDAMAQYTMRQIGKLLTKAPTYKSLLTEGLLDPEKHQSAWYNSASSYDLYDKSLE